MKTCLFMLAPPFLKVLLNKCLFMLGPLFCPLGIFWFSTARAPSLNSWGPFFKGIYQDFCLSILVPPFWSFVLECFGSGRHARPKPLGRFQSCPSGKFNSWLKGAKWTKSGPKRLLTSILVKIAVSRHSNKIFLMAI